MKILIFKPHQNPCMADVPGTLESLQGVVGGYLETVYPWDDPVAIVCDEDARVKGKELNRCVASGLAIAGTFFLCGLDMDGFTDLPEELAQKYGKLLFHPQAFVRTPRGIEVLDKTGKLTPAAQADTQAHDIYLENGYSDRDDYLESLADEYDVPAYVVFALADLLGPNEDFDGLVNSVEDAANGEWF